MRGCLDRLLGNETVLIWRALSVNMLDDERSVRDEDLFSQIRLDLPGLESVRDAVAQEDWTSARRALRYEIRSMVEWRPRCGSVGNRT